MDGQDCGIIRQYRPVGIPACAGMTVETAGMTVGGGRPKVTRHKALPPRIPAYAGMTVERRRELRRGIIGWLIIGLRTGMILDNALSPIKKASPAPSNPFRGSGKA